MHLNVQNNLECAKAVLEKFSPDHPSLVLFHAGPSVKDNLEFARAFFDPVGHVQILSFKAGLTCLLFLNT